MPPSPVEPPSTPLRNQCGESLARPTFSKPGISAILASYFPKLAGRANGALNLFHIAAAFVVQYATGVVLQHWTSERWALSRASLSDSLCSRSRASGRGMDLVPVSASRKRYATKAGASRARILDQQGADQSQEKLTSEMLLACWS
jgi:hypothetical protein